MPYKMYMVVWTADTRRKLYEVSTKSYDTSRLLKSIQEVKTIHMPVGCDAFRVMLMTNQKVPSSQRCNDNCCQSAPGGLEQGASEQLQRSFRLQSKMRTSWRGAHNKAIAILP